MQRTYRVPLARTGWVALVALLVLCAWPGTSIAGGASNPTEAGPALLERGTGYGASDATAAAGVKALQRTLRALGWQPGPVDGRFGPRTEAAVVRFQHSAGVAVDAIVGPQTRRALTNAVASPLRRGAGYAQPNGSPRVRALQSRLRRQGFSRGPVDGVFGPRTEAALRRFQEHGGLPANGVATERTARLLTRTETTSTSTSTSTSDSKPAKRTAYRPVSHRSGATTEPDDGLPVPLMIVIGLVGLLMGAALAILIPRVGRGGSPVPAAQRGVPEATPRPRPRLVPPLEEADAQPEANDQPETPVVASETLRVLGYASVRDAGHGNHPDLEQQSEAIASFCADRGWELLGVVTDSEMATDRGLVRPGLQRVLPRIGQGEASYLVVSQLGRLGSSAADISRILEAIRRAGGQLVAMDVGLDTASSDARVALRALASMGIWGREAEPAVDAGPRRVAALRASVPRATRASSDEVTRLKDRVARMRADGMTLQAIATRLNEEGVATIGGATTWRPSSVRHALTSGRRKTGETGDKRAGGGRR